MSLLILNIVREIFETLVKRKDVCFRQKKKIHEHLNLRLVSEIHRSHLMLSPDTVGELKPDRGGNLVTGVHSVFKN